MDALRLFAFLMVFVHHMPRIGDGAAGRVFMRTGSYGLSLFFLLSAYLIGELLLREREKTGTIRIRNFFARRLLRIWPLYLLAIILGYAIGLLFRSKYIPPSAFKYLFLMGGNFFVQKFSWDRLGVISPLWSLSIEEQFYAVIPAIGKLGGKVALAIFAVLAIGFAYASLIVLGFRTVDPVSQVWTNSLVQFQFFGAGLLLAIVTHGKKWTASLPIRVTLLASGIFMLMLVEVACRLHGVTTEDAKHLVSGYAVALIACLAIFLAFLDIKITFPAKVLRLGKISYGLYVFHSFFLAIVLTRRMNFLETMLAIFICLAATILTANLSYEFFEIPILRYKQHFELVKTREA